MKFDYKVLLRERLFGQARTNAECGSSTALNKATKVIVMKGGFI